MLISKDMYRTIKTLKIVVFVAFITSSCVREDEGSCGITVRFSYTYNILSVNALKGQVDEVSLYIFGEDDILVKQYTNVVTPQVNDFIRLTDLKSGNYRLVTWAQSKNLASDMSYYSIPKLKAGVSSIEELTYVMRREEASGFQQHELNNFLVGVIDVKVDDNNSNVTIDLKKVTNKIRVVLFPYKPGNSLDVTDYEYSIVDKVGNGHINYDYKLLPDKQIIYRPYYVANLNPEKVGGLSPNEIEKAAVVEINISRLLVENAPRLRIINKKEGKEIVSINLPWIFSLTEMENNKNWSLQEYLDRQDKYSLVLFFNDETWMNETFIINGWVINSKDILL